MGASGHPNVVPWDLIFLLLESGIYMLAFGHINREGCFRRPKNRKTGGAPPDLGAGH